MYRTPIYRAAMYRAAILAFVLLSASCGGVVDAPTTEPAASDVTTTAVTSTAPQTTSGADVTTTVVTSAPPAPQTSAPVLTTTTLGDGNPAIRIDQIVFATEPYLVLANRGTAVGSTSGMWICQFPSYYELPAIDLRPGERLAVSLGDGEVPDLIGIVATVDVARPLGTLASRDGEVGLYTSNEFNSANAIVDYVEWGFPGHARSPVAIAAQIWPTNGYVVAPAEILALMAQTFPTVGPEDWYAEIGG